MWQATWYRSYFQHRYKEKNCYIQKEGKFLTYMRNCEQKATIGTVKSSLKIPPWHTGVVPIKISGAVIKEQMAYFLTDDNSTKGRDPNININNGIHTIKGKTSVNFLVSNYMNKHITFNKGEYVGHLEPTLTYDTAMDQSEANSTNSIMLQKMMAEQVKLDIFDSPCHKLKPGIQNKLDVLLKEYESQFAKDETPLTQMTINTGTYDPMSQKPYPIAKKNYQWVKEEIEKLLAAKVIPSSRSSWSVPIIIGPKGDGGKWLVINFRALNKVTRKFTWPMPKVEDIFLKLNRAKYFTTYDLRAGYHHIPLDKSSIPKTAFNSPFQKYEYIKVPFGLSQAPAYFQELMTCILIDFNFAIAYLDNIIIFSKTPEEHLTHIRKVFEKLHSGNLSMKLSKCHFFSKEIQYLGHILSTKGICPLPSKTQAIQQMQPQTTPKQVQAFLGLVQYYRKFIKNFAKIAKPLILLTRQQVKLDWTPSHHTAFLTLKEAIIQAPILCYPNPNKRYIIYTDAFDDAWGAQLSQEHDGTEFPIAFLSHTFTETQRKWSTTKQEAYGVYYAVTKWNCYLQGADIIVRNNHKPLTKFINGNNANNKVNRWGLEVATYNIVFEWISGVKNKAADCLSRLMKQLPATPTTINMLTVTHTDGPAFNTRSQTRQDSTSHNPTTQLNTAPDVSPDPNPTPKSLTADSLEALLQMQKTNLFCKHISKCLSNGKAPQHKADLFTHIRGLLYKHVMDSGQKFLALVIPKSWKWSSQF